MLQVKTPAKINLYMEVIGRRSDGYHEIRSLVTPVSVFDTLTLVKTDGVIDTTVVQGNGFRAEDLVDLHPERNLATRAAVALKEETGYAGGVNITVDKRIPVGGGLGGGSADAAGVLVGLNALWETGLTPEALAVLGARLGCDVPALVHGGMVLMEGRGELVSRPACRPADMHLVLVNPGFSVLTRDIYERYIPPLTSVRPGIKNMVSALESGDVDTVGRSLFNGLQDTVFRKYPLIEQTAEALTEAGSIGVLLCGSGASVLGLARHEADARRMAALVESRLRFPVWVHAVKTLPDGVMVAHGPLEARV